MPESVSFVQTHSNRSKNKNVRNSHIYYETVIILKIIIFKPRILYDLDQQPSKINTLEKKFAARKVQKNSLWSY